jgi:dTDP-4-dehydrorhamnose 3,5-epimerase
MKFTEQKIPGLWLIEPESFKDERGAFRRHFCVKEFADHNIETKISQTNLSANFSKYTLRGFHYQVKPFEEYKTISAMSGGIYNVVVDLRPESPMFLKWLSFEITEENQLSLHVPGGCANAYLTIKDNTVIHYYMSEFYAPNSYCGFRYNDPFFNFEWPCEPKVISEKDLAYPDFDPSTVTKP